jgi:predicted GH43/DUF377 family glycosyl hydrolase
MWYSGSDASRSQIGHATSDDGVTWTKDERINPVLPAGGLGAWDSLMVFKPRVHYNGENYEMWYSGRARALGSYDPFTWTAAVGHAVSSDGLTWTKSPGNPVLAPGTPGSWDAVGANVGDVLVDPSAPPEERYKMWYIGFDGSKFRVGYATAPADVPTAVHGTDGAVPTGLSLAQNYPNPFNSTTSIRFEMSLSTVVSLTVYDALGQRAATLIDGPVHPGEHEVQWDARGMASGVYLYRLEAGAFSQTRRLVLLR